MNFGIMENLDSYETSVEIGRQKFVISREDLGNFRNELEQLVKKYRI